MISGQLPSNLADRSAPESGMQGCIFLDSCCQTSQPDAEPDEGGISFVLYSGIPAQARLNLSVFRAWLTAFVLLVQAASKLGVGREAWHLFLEEELISDLQASKQRHFSAF